MKVTVETTTGKTTIDTNYIAAITQTESGGRSLMFPSKMFHLEIHMTSGTIFNADLREDEMILFYASWEEGLRYMKNVLTGEEE